MYNGRVGRYNETALTPQFNLLWRSVSSFITAAIGLAEPGSHQRTQQIASPNPHLSFHLHGPFQLNEAVRCQRYFWPSGFLKLLNFSGLHFVAGLETASLYRTCMRVRAVCI
jgi:hypothetical protein